MEFTWNPLGIHLESIWSPVELWNAFGIQWNGGGINIIIPCGIQMEIPDGIWPFHVDSMWNIGGMESPKRVVSQPKYIPSGIRWIPLGFHMDSMWNT